MKARTNSVEVLGWVNKAIYDFDRQVLNVVPLDSHERGPNLNCKKEKKLTNLSWQSPSLLENAIVEVDRKNGLHDPYALKALLRFLSELRCKEIVLMAKSVLVPKTVEHALSCVGEGSFRHVQMVMLFHPAFVSEPIINKLLRFEKLLFLILENSPFEKNIQNKVFFVRGKVSTRKAPSKGDFRVNLHLYAESQQFNTYLNKKVFISRLGKIKNAPKAEQDFGTLDCTDIAFEHLRAIINSKGFQSKWLAKKAVCDGCKNCEFRHACVDNRIPKQRGDGSWFFSSECNYDPFQGKWKHGEGNTKLL